MINTIWHGVFLINMILTVMVAALNGELCFIVLFSISIRNILNVILGPTHNSVASCETHLSVHQITDTF